MAGRTAAPGPIDQIFEQGLHEFLHQFIADTPGSATPSPPIIALSNRFENTMRLSIRHTTTYRFLQPACARPATPAAQAQGHARPDHPRMGHAPRRRRLEVEYDDQHHNATTLVSLEPGAEEVSVTCTGLVDTSDKAGIIGQHAGHMPLWCFLRPTPLTRPGRNSVRLPGSVADREQPLEFLHALSERCAPRSNTARRDRCRDDAEKALAAGQGVCQDQAHVFIAPARLLGRFRCAMSAAT
jgi:transglutaminase-like putative cysteine protease